LDGHSFLFLTFDECPAKFCDYAVDTVFARDWPHDQAEMEEMLMAATQMWKINRLNSYDAQVYETDYEDPWLALSEMDKASRHQRRMQIMRDKHLQEFRRLRDERRQHLRNPLRPFSRDDMEQWFLQMLRPYLIAKQTTLQEVTPNLYRRFPQAHAPLLPPAGDPFGVYGAPVTFREGSDPGAASDFSTFKEGSDPGAAPVLSPTEKPLGSFGSLEPDDRLGASGVFHVAANCLSQASSEKSEAESL
jgi:hypothetical protein